MKKTEYPQKINWPPFCCVPSLFYSALNQLQLDYNTPLVLPSALNVLVGPDDDNPLGLEITNEIQSRGIEVKDAIERINSLLTEIDPNFKFIHIPFDSIAFGLYRDLLIEMLSRGLVVGVGLDYSTLSGIKRGVCKHVFKICEIRDGKVLLLDTSGELDESEFIVSLTDIENATLAISDGYWVFGHAEDLRLPFI